MFSFDSILLLFLLSSFSCNTDTHTSSQKPLKDIAQNTLIQKLRKKAKTANEFCTNKKMNTTMYFLIDMSIHPGKNRLFIWDNDKDTFIYSTLVTHGSCDVYEENETKFSKAKFGKQAESHCSEIGKYKIGARGASKWGVGIKYTLHGLESTNSNAASRYIVLHSWSVIPEQEVYPEYIALSWGCPAVSNNSMLYLDKVLKKENKPVLLWIYN